jgi:transcriptional antiterminator NusG
MAHKNRYDSTRQWYAIHTYSGYEEKVADSIRQRAETVDMADKIFDAMVPKEKQIQIKNGKRKVIEAKIFQGYVLVEMKLTDETWYIVRNTPGVTGFVGSGTEPTPVSDSEIAKIKKRMGVEDPKHQIDFQPREKSSISLTAHSRASTVPCLRSTPPRASSKSWSACLAETPLSSSTRSRSKKSKDCIETIQVVRSRPLVFYCNLCYNYINELASSA